MRFDDFRRWVWRTFRYQFRTTGSTWRVLWGGRDGRTGTGTGHPAVYTVEHQRRFAVWMRARHLVAPERLGAWLSFGGQFANGWIVNQGEGLVWLPDLEPEIGSLLDRGFVAVRCGWDGART